MRTPVPMAVGDMRRGGMIRESWLVLEEITGGVALNDKLGRDGLSVSDRARLLDRLAELTSRVVAAGLYHRDYHAGNILVTETSVGPQLALIDLHSARVGRCSARRRNRMLATMWRTLDNLAVSDGECAEFVRMAVGDCDELDDVVGTVRRIATRCTARRWKSRTRRCVKESTSFEQGRTRKGRYSVFRSFGRANLFRAVDLHKRGEGDLVTLLKTSRHGRVAAVRLGADQTVCVKEVRSASPRRWIQAVVRLGRGRRAWIAVNGLAARGFAVARPLGYLCERIGLTAAAEYVVTGFLETSSPLDQYVETPAYSSLGRAQRREFVRGLGRFMARLHERGVHQHDFKASNVLVEQSEPGEWTFYLVDLDSVRFIRRVSVRRRVKNMAQLAAAVSNTVSYPQRLRFLRAYAEVASLPWDEKDVVRRVTAISRARAGPWRV